MRGEPAAPSVRIAGRDVGGGNPCFVIAEAGVNHNGDLGMARQLIDAAAAAGADAVKFQTYTTERVTVREAPKAEYQLATTGAEESQFEMLKKLELTPEQHRALQGHAASRGILFMSTPFDEESADFLETLDLPAYKIPSGELTNLPFLMHVARKRRPMIVSTGMATLEEVGAAVEAIRGAASVPLVLLHCVSAYPAPASDANLRAMKSMADAFGVPVGYSDHTLGCEVAQAAIALGACMLEKHLTLDRHLPGPDHQASLEPQEMRQLVASLRLIESSLGDGVKRPRPIEADVAAVARKSIVAAAPIPAGERLTRELLTLKNPGTGLSPGELDRVVGRIAAVDIAADTLIRLEHLR